MRLSWLCVTVLAVAVVVVRGDDEIPDADPCNVETCTLPDCRCSSTDIPGGILPRNTPQFITITFDDAITVSNIPTYRELLYNRRNSNGCGIGTTFFVSHQYTNYQFVNELYNNGFEIALHSMTHLANQTYWAQASYEVISQEIGQQREQMAHFGSIPYGQINGVRAPFLQTAGNTFFQVIKDYDLTYDSSWATITFQNPGLWPYTLDYRSTQDCHIAPCPTRSIPGVWVTPLISWTDLNGFPCSFVDACVFVPNHNDEDAWFQFITRNFERHYLGTRAPFGFYIHEWYLSSHPAVFRALSRFIDMTSTLHDVFIVNEGEVIEWTKDPVPVDEYRTRCKTIQPSSCNTPQTCMLTNEITNATYWMGVCTACPRTHPWPGNPLGL